MPGRTRRRWNSSARTRGRSSTAAVSRRSTASRRASTARRSPSPSRPSAPSKNGGVQERDARGGVLVIGGGFAGSYVARLLGKRGATVVSRENFMLYTPLLPEAASGTLEPRHVVVPLRMMCPRADVLVGHARNLDLDRRTVQVETEEELLNVRYTQLVVAFGAVARALP